MKTQLVESHRERVRGIERGELKVVGQNVYTEREPSPLQEGEDGGILRVDPAVERAAIDALEAWRGERDDAAVERALEELRAAAARRSVNIMHATLAAARAGVTTGEWAAALREVFGEYRAPTGVGDAAAAPADDALTRAARPRRARVRGARPADQDPGRQARPRRPLERRRADRRPRPRRRHGRGLRGHPPDAGAHRRAPRSRRACTWSGLSILSGSHAELIPTVLAELREAGADVPVVVGGIIPPADEQALLEAGVARVYTPKDFEISRIMGDIVDLVAERNGVVRRAVALDGRPAELGRRLREGDRSAAPAALNLIEDRSRPRRDAAALLAEVSPAALGGEAAGAPRRASPARPAPASRRCCPRSWPTGARGQDGGRAGRRPVVASAPAARCWATARASSTTRATTAC